MALAAQYSFEIEQGAAWSKTMFLDNPDGSPMNLAGFTGRMQIRYQAGDPDPALIDIPSLNGSVAFEGNGITISLLGTDTDLLQQPDAVYDFFIYPGGDVTNGEKLLEGDIQIDLAVTR